MRNLLSSNFSRLWKNKEFWFCMCAMFVYSVIFMLNGCRQALRDTSEYVYTLDDYYFQFALSIGGFCAVFSSLFHGTDYSDGTIRNKIVVGHTRTGIYLSNLLLTFTATLLFLLAWILGAIPAMFLLGLWQIGAFGLTMYLLIAILYVAVFSAIFTAVNMLTVNKAFSVTMSMLLFLGLLIIAAQIDNALSQPEMTSNIVMTANGMEIGDPVPNPEYPTGTTRAVYEFINDFLPTGQCAQMAFLKIAHPVRMLLCSAFLTISVTWGGLRIFRRKNLN